MTFSEFCDRAKVTEAERRDLIVYLAVWRATETIRAMIPR